MPWKNVYHYRCSWRQCHTRRSLPKPLEEYARPPKCHRCGGTRFYKDHYRPKKETGKGLRKCYCDGYHFPHRLGAGVWCRHHPTGPTEEDMRDRYGGEAG